MTDKEYMGFQSSPELVALVFSPFLKYLSHTIYSIDYVENREEITAENFLIHLERTIENSQDQIASHGLKYEVVQNFVPQIRAFLLEIDIHNLLNWDEDPKGEDPTDAGLC